MTDSNTNPEQPKKANPLVDLAVSIIIPSIILMRLSGEDKLGPTGALLLALAFPIAWGLYDLTKNGVKNYVAILGVVSVLLTGSIGLLKLDAQWLAVKEAAIPFCIILGRWRGHQFNATDVIGVHAFQKLHQTCHRHIGQFSINHHIYAFFTSKGNVAVLPIDDYTRRTL